MTKQQFEALERVINQIGGGFNEEFYRDLEVVREFINNK